MDETTLNNYLSDSLSFLKERFSGFNAQIGIILGSGLGPFVENIQVFNAINTTDIPHYPASTVSGHSGRLVHGSVGGVELFVLQGRVHTYEGYQQWQVTYPTRLMHLLGVRSLIVTNSSGSSNPEFEPGNFMLIRDHHNFIFRDPLYRWEVTNSESLSPYNKEYISMAKDIAKKLDIKLYEGVLSANLGPAYETPAEVRFQRSLGGDAASMSTFPEVTVAHSLGLKVLGLSVLTNFAAVLNKTPLTHEEVTETADSVSENFSKLITELIKNININNKEEN